MFSNDLEKRFRGMFSKAEFAEAHTSNFTRTKHEGPELEGHRQIHHAATGKPSYVRKRAITRSWPRDPKGPFMKPGSAAAGKHAGNNQSLWGATVHDFYFTRRAPKIPGYATICTGSMLLRWVKEIGELQHAKYEIARAEAEADPYELLPCSMDTLLRLEDLDSPGNIGITNDQFKLENGRISARRHEKLQNRIPFHLLPEKLIVHDPDNTLSVRRISSLRRGADGDSAPRTYRLQLSQETRDAITKERATLSQPPEKMSLKGRAFATESPDMVAGETTHGSVSEATFAVFPPAPPPPLSTPEAHLYINAEDILGKGNHSYVYNVSVELPRDLVTEPYVCNECIEEAFFKKLREEAPDADIDGSRPISAQISELMSALDAKNGTTGKLCVDRGHSSESGLGANTYYEGGLRHVLIDVQYNTPGNYCVHEKWRNSAPTTFKASVGAKLSREGDEHLAREARNYQKFPRHFFEHWSGYNVIPPLIDPTPALAVVPQFYGYYVPEDGEATEDEYLSPILLIEDCGVPVEVDDLDLDDRNECASLLYRMHDEGWLHNSFFPRNILMQHGDISAWPVARKVEDRRFRIIDFGRSENTWKVDPTAFAKARSQEEEGCASMFKISH